jgi:hypothetical protein
MEDIGPYYYDATSILQALKTNPDNLFSTQLIEPTADGKGQWLITDYLSVISAFSENVLQIKLSEYGFSSLTLYLSCKQLDGHFYNANFGFSRLMEGEELTQREVYFFYLVVAENTIDVSRDIRKPASNEWASVNLTDFAPDELQTVLEIAENNGGTLFRNMQNDACTVVLSLNALDQDHNWIVRYISSQNQSNVLRLLIDSVTDEVEILE